MTTYKAIHGKTVQTLASDPDNAAFEGQLWFNSTSGDFKTITRVAGSWSTGGDLGTARYGLASSGPKSAAIVFGGSGLSDKAETYNGSSWTEVGDLNLARVGIVGADLGTQTATLAFGGYVSPA